MTTKRKFTVLLDHPTIVPAPDVVVSAARWETALKRGAERLRDDLPHGWKTCPPGKAVRVTVIAH